MCRAAWLFIVIFASAIGLSAPGWAASAVAPEPQVETPGSSNTIPVIHDRRLEWIDPAELRPQTVYLVEVRCRRGSRELTQLWIHAFAGETAVVKSMLNWRRTGETVIVPPDASRPPAQRYRCVVFAAAEGERSTPDPTVDLRTLQLDDPLQDEPAMYAAYLNAARGFVFGGLKLSVYCPEVNTVECQIWRQVTTAPRLTKIPGDLVADYLPGEALPLELMGSFTAALDCPDLGFVGRDGTVYGNEPPVK